jgi:2-polyprenyl-3-methyl-5-hydroxy-6-metoxy-1,4-benzoquinol methylase
MTASAAIRVRFGRLPLVLRMLLAGRLLKRAGVLTQYLYYLALESVSPGLSLERPRFTPHPAAGPAPSDRSDGIEFHLESDADARKEFAQPDPGRRSLVTSIADKFRTHACFLCDGPLMAVVRVCDADDAGDYIEISWCRDCDHLQYSVMPSRAWIANWYARHWDTAGTLSDKLETRGMTQRYRYRLAPYLRKGRLKILDIGAGYAEKTLPFKAAGHELHCVEATTARADYLRRHADRVYFGTLDDPEIADALRRSGPFDLIFTYHVIEHIYNPRAELQLLREIAADDAVFYLAIPELYKEGILNNIYALEHIASFSRRSAQRLMARVGFRPIVAKDDLFQYYSNYCQYLVGRKAKDGDAPAPEAAPRDIVGFLTRALDLDRIARLEGNAFTYSYNGHAPLTYRVSEESKRKCADPASHLPLRIYHHGLPLFWMP